MLPTYVYQCQSCGHQEEIVCRIADRPEIIDCPSPSGKVGEYCIGQMRQILTVPTIRCDDAVNVPWLRRAMNYLEPGHEQSGRPIDTREKYESYLKERDLRSADSENLSAI